MSITRRIFLRNGSLAVIGTAAIPLFLTRAAYAAQSVGAKNKRLVVIFQRGAADGLNIVVPHAERSYYAMRPSINIPRNAVLDLDGFFGLHPSLSPFQPLWKQRHLAIVHAAGSPDPTRSHFDAQDFMESGTPGVKATEDGWLNRDAAFFASVRFVRPLHFAPSPWGLRCRAFFPAASPQSPSTTLTISAWAETIPKPRPMPTPSKPCTSTRSIPCCTAPARKPSTR